MFAPQIASHLLEKMRAHGNALNYSWRVLEAGNWKLFHSFPIPVVIFIPQTVFICRCSHGVGKGALKCFSPRWWSMTFHFACKYQRIREGPSKTLRNVDKQKDNFCILAERCINYCLQDLLEPLGCPGSPLFCDASWVASPGKRVGFEFFVFLSAWKRRLK